MKRIKSKSARKISKRINNLSRLELCDLDKDIISKYINNSFKIPYNSFIQQGNKGYVFRACMNKNNENKPFSSVNRIAFNPNPDYIGRANLKGKGIGYGASSLDIAAIEVCQESLRTTNEIFFYLTIGMWQLISDINTSVICHSKKALAKGTDLYQAYISITNQKVIEYGFSKKQLRLWNLKNRFFAEQFAKTKINCNNDYLFTALYTNSIFNSVNPEFDSVWYPSQAYNYLGFNIAYKPRLVESGIMKIQKVFNVKITFFQNNKLYPRIDIINETERIKDDKIEW